MHSRSASSIFTTCHMTTLRGVGCRLLVPLSLQDCKERTMSMTRSTWLAVLAIFAAGTGRRAFLAPGRAAVGHFVIIRRRGARRLFRRRDCECDPGVPAIGPILRGEFLVAFEIEVTLGRGAQGNNEAELRADANHARLEATH